MKAYKTINDQWLKDLFKEPDKVSNSATAYEFVPLVFRASRLRANAISKVPIRLFDKYDDKKEMKWEFQTDSKRFMWITEMSMCIAGCAFWTPVLRGAKVIDYEYLNPYDMDVKVKKTDSDGYAIHFHQTSTGETWTNVPRRGQYELLYFHEFNLQSPYLPGASMASNALGDVQLIQYLQRFASHFFENGAQPVTLLAMESVSDDERLRVENWFKRAATGIGNAFKVLGVRAGAMEASILTPPLRDLVIPELHEQARRNTALSFEIPITMLEDAANFATAISGRTGFYEDTIIPRSGTVMGALNEQLFGKTKLIALQDYNELSMFQEDETKRADVATKYFTITNDMRLAFELAGVELSAEQLARLQKDAVLEQETPEADKPDDKPDDKDDPMADDLKRWQRKATKRLKDGKGADCDFESDYIPAWMIADIKAELADSNTVDEVVDVFGKKRSQDITALLSELKSVMEVVNVQPAGN